MSNDVESPPAGNRMLDAIERLGNRVPHPAVLFLLMIVFVIGLSHLLNLGRVSASYERINVETHEAERVTTAVRSLLSAEGIRFIFTSVVPNFINFGPVGIILVAMIGIGLAERSGLITALIRKTVEVAPRSAITAIIVTLGVLSSIASDAGYLVLIPLGAIAFHSLKRHPLAGLAAAFAGVAAAFGANFLVKPIDGILAEMTNDAIHAVDPTLSIDMTSNFYFGAASSIVLIVVCTIVSDWVVEPRLGAYGGEAPPAENVKMSSTESRGLVWAGVALVAYLALIAYLTLPQHAPLRNPETGMLVGNSPLMDSLVFLIMLAFGVTGLAYGWGANTIRSADAAIDAMTKTLADLAGLLLLFFVISQFVAYFNFSNIGTVLAVNLADLLKDADLNNVTLLLAFLVIGVLMSIPVPNILPKWAILAPVFVPLFLKLGIEPEAVLAAYRVSDSPPNVINPLLPHFALVVGFAQRWQKSAGVGTVVAMMLPYTAATFIAWTALFFAWYLCGLPFGP
ncbi:MAG: AbgT family transporter [Planctomycetaceae bacterium]|uniref:p-aminobenzoyl-glutamate transport protein n=1 Tax=Lacipirellula limnantheis TaxID=2528024 RepID=A0A517U518_9BACT|nr:AbgT family transporter [Lacipirellula limnantheis]MBL9163076.1 AbgT family transporter [Planctomycetaceae bacterium]QDT75697.1 p-aminobenzoyl-glutamate transport protein [Lacipirellula limnantheis]